MPNPMHWPAFHRATYWRSRLGGFRFYWRTKTALKRYSRALAYARGRLSADQAQSMFFDLEAPAGWYQLMTLSVDDVMEDAQERFEPHPGLRDLVDEACQHVASHFEAIGDQHFENRQWALDKVEEYAREREIALKKTEDYAEMSVA